MENVTGEEYGPLSISSPTCSQRDSHSILRVSPSLHPWNWKRHEDRYTNKHTAPSLSVHAPHTDSVAIIWSYGCLFPLRIWLQASLLFLNASDDPKRYGWTFRFNVLDGKYIPGVGVGIGRKTMDHSESPRWQSACWNLAEVVYWASDSYRNKEFSNRFGAIKHGNVCSHFVLSELRFSSISPRLGSFTETIS